MRNLFKFIIYSGFVSYCLLNYANADSIFNRLDNNVNFALSMENSSANTNFNAGMNASILSNNFWYNFGITGIVTSNPSEQPSQAYTGSILNGKFGYSFVNASNLNIIPYLGIAYGNSGISAHTDSQPIFDYTLSTLDLSAGIKPEFAIGNQLKISLDTNMIYHQQGMTVPNSLTTQAHVDVANGYITTTPAIQWNPIGNFSIEAYYLIPIAITNNTQQYNVINQTYSSAALINAAQGIDNTVGINIGWLF